MIIMSEDKPYTFEAYLSCATHELGSLQVILDRSNRHNVALPIETSAVSQVKQAVQGLNKVIRHLSTKRPQGKKWNTLVERTANAFDTVGEVFYGQVFATVDPRTIGGKRRPIYSNIAQGMRESKGKHVTTIWFELNMPGYEINDGYCSGAVPIVRLQHLEATVKKAVEKAERRKLIRV